MTGRYPIRWTPVSPVRKQDNIVSSRVRVTKQLGFETELDKDPVINMNFIMSNEYSRQWFKKRDEYVNEIVTQKQNRMEAAKIRRRYVKRKSKRDLEEAAEIAKPKRKPKKYPGPCDRN